MEWEFPPIGALRSCGRGHSPREPHTVNAPLDVDRNEGRVGATVSVPVPNPTQAQPHPKGKDTDPNPLRFGVTTPPQKTRERSFPGHCGGDTQEGATAQKNKRIMISQGAAETIVDQMQNSVEALRSHIGSNDGDQRLPAGMYEPGGVASLAQPKVAVDDQGKPIWDTLQ